MTPDAPPPLPIAHRVQQARTITRAPESGKKFPCPQCGARLDFDPSERGLKCPYCGYSQAIVHEADAQILERDYRDYLQREESQGSVIEGRSTETRCTGCGAMVLLEDNVATERCPFCGTFLEGEPEVAKAMIPTESVLPFALDLRQARERFAKWMEGLWFAPSELSKVAALGQLTGIYLPFWTYDAMTDSYYEGQRGDNYTVTTHHTVSDANGGTRTVPRTETRIRWHWVSGEVEHFFDDVLICASNELPKYLIAKLGDWPLHEMEPFTASYLSGFRTERYAIGLQDGFDIAKTIMESEIRRLVCRDIGGDHQRIQELRTRHHAITFKHILLPVWVAVYRYHEKTYQIIINAQSGRLAGNRPWSFSKVIGWIVLALLVVGLIVGGISLLIR